MQCGWPWPPCTFLSRIFKPIRPLPFQFHILGVLPWTFKKKVCCKYSCLQQEDICQITSHTVVCVYSVGMNKLLIMRNLNQTRRRWRNFDLPRVALFGGLSRWPETNMKRIHWPAVPYHTFKPLRCLSHGHRKTATLCVLTVRPQENTWFTEEDVNSVLLRILENDLFKYLSIWWCHWGFNLLLDTSEDAASWG